MLAFKKHIVIEDPKHTVLSDLPFRSGQRVEIFIISEDDEIAGRIKTFKKLLKTTHALPQAKAITEKEIAKEIALYRKKK